MSNGTPELRELLFAGEEIVRDQWRQMDDAAITEAILSRGTAASSALDRIAQIGALVVERRSEEGAGLVIETLVRLYRDSGVEGATEGQRQVPEGVAARRRREVAARVYVLGALAVYKAAFQFVRPLVLQRPDDKRRMRFWLRDTVTSLARAEEFKKPSLIPVVAEYVADHDVLFRRFRKSRDEVVNALCQFDFLQCLVATAEAEDVYECYPNFGIYHNERTQPVIAQVVTNKPARQVVAGVSDPRLAEIIRAIDHMAGEQFFSYSGWDSGWWMIDDIGRFLERYPVGQ